MSNSLAPQAPSDAPLPGVRELVDEYAAAHGAGQPPVPGRVRPEGPGVVRGHGASTGVVHAEFFLLDNRTHRAPNRAPADERPGCASGPRP